MRQTRARTFRPPRIAVFLVNYGAWSSPSVINAVNTLAEQGYAVDIFTDSQEPPRFIHNGELPIQLYEMRGASGSPQPAQGLLPRNQSKARRWLRRSLPGFAGDILSDLWATFGRIPPRIIKYVHRALPVIRANGPYSCFIGVEPHGLTAATIIGKLCGAPVVYWSLELWLWKESRKLWLREMKLAENFCQRRAAFTVIQDDERADCLAEDNQISRADFVIVPAAARGPSRTERGDYLRSKFGIGDSQKIILYAGSIQSWARCLDLVSAAQAWPQDLALVIHGYGSAEYFEEIRSRSLVPGRVHFSFDPVPYDQLDNLIGSADIGVAFYKDMGLNWSLIGSASGKLSHYLKCGLPVITSDSQSLQRILNAYGCGICVSSPYQTLAAAQKILADYPIYQANAARCYREKLNFDNYFGAVLQRIERLRAEPLELTHQSFSR